MSINIKKLKNYLETKNSYEIFNINYTKKEKECINNFIISKYGLKLKIIFLIFKL